jgi:hypothetical protein
MNTTKFNIEPNTAIRIRTEGDQIMVTLKHTASGEPCFQDCTRATGEGEYLAVVSEFVMVVGNTIMHGAFSDLDHAERSARTWGRGSQARRVPPYLVVPGFGKVAEIVAVLS